MYCDSVKFKYDEMGSFLLSIDSSLTDSGRLLWWSRAFEMIMDYTTEELKKMKINSFMTDSMAASHNLGLKNYIVTGLPQKLYKNFMVPFINKTKYCEMVNMQVKPFVLFNPFKVTLISYGEMNSNFGSDYIVVNKYGFVETFTPGFAKILGKHIHMGYQDKLPLIYFCPSIVSFLIANSPLFKNQFEKFDEDKLPIFKKTVNKCGTETFIENFIWNSFDDNKLVQMPNVLTESSFLEKPRGLYDFIHEHINSLTESRTTSLITMRITKQQASCPENIYFYIEFINVKHYQDLIKSSTRLTHNPPLKWLMKLGSFEKQLDERFQQSVIIQELKKMMDNKENDHDEASIHEDLNDRHATKQPLDIKKLNFNTNKFVNKASQITKLLKYMKPLQTEEYPINDFENNDFDPTNESATLLINSQAGESENQDIAEKKLHYKSAFLQPERQTIAQRNYFYLKIFLFSRFVFYNSFLIAAFILSITVN